MLIYFSTLLEDLNELLPTRDWTYDVRFVRTILAMIVALCVAYVIIKIANKFTPKIAELITDEAATRKNSDNLLAVRRTETILNVVSSVGKALIVLVSLYLGWRLMNPGSAPLAIIGAGTLFFVIGYATVTPLLRDITSGIIMITERWFEIGDYVEVDPFWELSGVVEQINLRATKLRSLSGEIIHIHNQNIQGVRVVPRGLRTISIDVFAKDKDKGRSLIEEVIPSLPVGPSLIATPLAITKTEKLGNIWRITLTGQTSPGREWLIEEFAIKALKQMDETMGKDKTMVYEPISRYTDAAAERRFLKSIKGKQAKSRSRTRRRDNVTEVHEVTE